MKYLIFILILIFLNIIYGNVVIKNQDGVQLASGANDAEYNEKDLTSQKSYIFSHNSNKSMQIDIKALEIAANYKVIFKNFKIDGKSSVTSPSTAKLWGCSRYWEIQIINSFKKSNGNFKIQVTLKDDHDCEVFYNQENPQTQNKNSKDTDTNISENNTNSDNTVQDGDLNESGSSQKKLEKSGSESSVSTKSNNSQLTNHVSYVYILIFIILTFTFI